ncbi:MAG: RHS repeat-associated core domain-containing protein [Nitrospira sp.]|nr:RHS repeat-associated core domain-containing protein [Nitrospira sp.]
MTNTFDAANRLTASTRNGATVEPIYNGVGYRMGQTTGVTTTNFVLDIAGGLPEVIYTSEGNVYLHLPGVIVATSSTGETRYLLGDGLGSVRQTVDENGAVVAYNEFDPYGNPVQNGSGPYGFTGEWWEDEVGLLHLRARWYLVETGTFLSRDPVESEPPYAYVRGNPINATDPTGLWIWGYPTGINNWYHYRIELHYEGAYGVNPDKQLEFTIPGFGTRVDMFNSRSGDVYEIEPWFMRKKAQTEASEKTVQLRRARPHLNGVFQGQPYNWTNTLFQLGRGIDWPGKLRSDVPGFPNVELVADYVDPGSVIYWLEPKVTVPVYAIENLEVTNKRLLRERNWQPIQGGLTPQPAWARTCGQVLVAVGTAIIIVTLVEDLTLVGIADDVVTVPGGLLLINMGQRLAGYVPVSP